MTDYKMEAAKAAAKFIKPGYTIGVGAGSTIAHLINTIQADSELSSSVTLVSSSYNTSNLILKAGLHLQNSATVKKIDIYFDGCDQFDPALNALKSGGGIHTTEKILASMAEQFILIGDTTKLSSQLEPVYPLVIEVIPAAYNGVTQQINKLYPDATIVQRMSSQKDGALISEYGNYLADIHFKTLPALQQLNIDVKMIPGLVEHSLFYQIASLAVIAGETGIQTVSPK